MGDKVVTGGFLLPRKISAKETERGEPGDLVNQKFSISLGASPDQCRPDSLGTAAPGPAGKPCQEPWGHGPGVAGSWMLTFAMGKEETLEAGVPEKPLFNSTSIAYWLLCSRHEGQEKLRNYTSVIGSMGMSLWEWWLDRYKCSFIFQSPRMRRFPGVRGHWRLVLKEG